MNENMEEMINKNVLTFNPLYEVIKCKSKIKEEVLDGEWTTCHVEYDFIYRRRKSILNSDENLFTNPSKDPNKDRYYYAQEVTPIKTKYVHGTCIGDDSSGYQPKEQYFTTADTIQSNGNVAQER